MFSRNSARVDSSGGRIVRIESTKKRMPSVLGSRPAEVCGLCSSPASSRSAIALRSVAGLRFKPVVLASAREPMGRPLRIYSHTTARKMRRDLSLVFSVIEGRL